MRLVPESFDDDKIFLPTLADLMGKTRVDADSRMTAQYPAAAPASVSIRLRDGRVLSEEVTYPKGHAADPMSDSEVVDKFARLAGGRSEACAGSWMRSGTSSQAPTLAPQYCLTLP